MKKYTLLFLLLVGSTSLFGQKWNVDKAHAKVGFTVTHLMLSEVEGNFKKFDATLISAKPDLSDAIFNLTIDPASVDTDNEQRDNDLKGDRFFDVNKFPEIAFKSSSVKLVQGNKYKVAGNLTMKGVTKPVELDLTLNGFGKNMRTQKPIAGFKVTGLINRTDFGVGSAPAAMISEEIQIKANGEFNQE